MNKQTQVSYWNDVFAYLHIVFRTFMFNNIDSI